MPYITLGTTSQLQIKVPTRGSTGWDEVLRTDTFLKIAQHDHSGTSGNGTQLATAALAADSVTGAKILLDNDEYLRGRNAADSADKNIIKVNASDEIEFGTTVGVITIQDDGLSILDNSDNTKIIAFNASNITTGTTRTLSSPDASGIIVLNDNTATLTNKTLTGNTAVNLVSGSGTLTLNTSGTVTLPNATDTLVGLATTDTLTNKTLTSPTINGGALNSPTTLDVSDAVFSIQDNADATKEIRFQASGITTGTIRTATMPDADITLVGTAATQTLTNKTIDSDNNTITNIVNADIKAAAAIAVNKLAATTASRALASDASGFITASATTDTELGYVSGVTSAIQTQIDAKLTDPMTTNGDLIIENSGPQRLAIGTAGQVLTVSGGLPAWGTNTVAPIAPVAKTTTYTATTSDDAILADTSGGGWTLTLYAASGNAGKTLTVKKTTSDTNELVIDANASETIDGATTRTLVTQYESVTLECDGSNWHIISNVNNGYDLVTMIAANNTWSFSAGAILQTSGTVNNTGNGLLTTTSTNPLKFTSTAKCKVDLSWSMYLDGANRIYIRRNGTTIIMESATAVTNAMTNLTLNYVLNDGDYIEFGMTAGSPRGISDNSYLNIVATKLED